MYGVIASSVPFRYGEASQPTYRRTVSTGEEGGRGWLLGSVRVGVYDRVPAADQVERGTRQVRATGVCTETKLSGNWMEPIEVGQRPS